MAGALINGGLIVRIGHHRTFIALAALATLASLGYLLFDQPLVWALLRALFGYCLVGIYTALESGMHASATNAQRGRVFASYLAITYLGISVGQFLLRVGGPSGNLQSVLVAALIVSSLVPVTLMDGWPERRAAALMPILAGDRWDGLRELLRSAPLGVPVCIGAGLLSSAFYTMMPVYLVQLGYDVPGVARFMGIALLCALAAQWPAGRLSDRVERRTVIFCVTLAAGGTSALLALLPWPWAIDAVGFVYVSLTFTLYGLIVSHVNDLVDRRRRVAVSAALLLLFAIGGLLGPTIASLCIARFGPAGLFIFTLTICAGLAAMTWPNREPKPQ
jgi:MFS family permease